MLIKPGDLGLPENVNGRIGFQSLFGNGESGYLFRNFSDLSKLYTQYTGTPPVTVYGNPVGLVLDESQMIGKTVPQAAANSPELRGNGTIGLVGTATAATYNTSTGEATATRAADGGNQSYVTVPVTSGDTYLIDLTVTTTGVNVRDTATGSVSYTFAVVGARKQVVVRSGTTALFFQSNTNSTTASFIIHSIKRIPGNHVSQSSTTRRPAWVAPTEIAGNLSLDGVDDALTSPFRPMLTGTGLTMAVSFFVADNAGTQRIIMGGGTSSDRAFIALIASGALGIGWGTQVNRGVTFQDLRNGWHTVIVTGEGSTRDIWLDGKNITSDFAAASGTPGNTGPIAIGGRQTVGGGAVDQNMPGNISAVLTLDRKVSEKEINFITTEFRKTYATPTPTLTSKLFAGGENGFSYENFNGTGDLFTSHSTGVNVSIDNELVGIALDRSRWGSANTLNQVLALSPNLTTPGSWVMSTGGGTSTAVESPAGTLTLVSDSSGSRGDFQMTTEANTLYSVDLTIATSAVSVLVGNGQGFSGFLGVSPNPGTYRFFFFSTGTTTWIRLARNAAGTAVVSGIQVRKIPGNHNVQTTTGRLPVWRAPSDYSANIQFDGVDDAWLNAFRPNATGTGLTMAVAFYSTQGNVQASPMGGGSSVGPSRAYIALLSNGVLSVGWGTQVNRGGATVDLRNGWHIVVVTGEASNRDVWLDGVNITAQFASAVGSPANGAMAIGARQNESGLPDLFMPGNVSAALTLDRRVTVDEIQDINREFRKTFTTQEPTLATRLFGAGEKGYLFDNLKKLDRLFTTSSGGVNVAVDTDPVATFLDNHSWGGRDYAQQMSLQSNVAPPFVVGGTGWTVSGNDGTHIITFGADSMRYQSDTTSPVLSLSVSGLLVQGQYYEITTNVTTYVSGSLKIDGFGGAGAVVANALGIKKTVFQALGTTLQIVRNSTNVDMTLSSIILKEIPGNAGFQNTLVDRPSWRFGGNFPFLQNAGGAADALLTQFYPFASGTGLTMAAAFNAHLSSSIAIGGGNTGTNNRATIGLQSSGQLSVGWGTEISETVTVDRRNLNLVMIVTGDATSREVWLNGENVTSLFAAPSGLPNNTGGALAIAGRQNTTNGTTDRNLGGNVFAALAVDRRVTLDEIRQITREFQAKFPPT